MTRYDLTDLEWHAIEPLLPNKPRGVPRVDDRRVLNGIFGFYDPVPLGVMSPKDMDHTQPAIIVSGAGRLAEFGTGCWMQSGTRRMTASR